MWIKSQKHIRIFFLIFHFFNSQIWLNYLIDDPYLGYIIEKEREKKIWFFFTLKFWLNYCYRNLKKTIDFRTFKFFIQLFGCI